MSASNLKGSLLEFIVRRLLTNCGFTRVKPDGLFIYKKSGLTMVNGKGAAHDADVLMNPPIQMPFSYPFRINFECKAYKDTIGLPIIRNALGLRYDINEFEVVTRKQLKERQNNRRSSLAIDNRQRFNYQVGVASIEEFRKPALEFAANNRIPLFSLRWLLPNNICDKFHDITNDYLANFSNEQLKKLHDYLKGVEAVNTSDLLQEEETIFKEIYDSIIELEKNVVIGLLESGDLLFLVTQNQNSRDYLLNNEQIMSSRFHYMRENRKHWTLSIDEENGQNIEFNFHLPKNIAERWSGQRYEAQEAVNIKSALFPTVFIFIKDENNTNRLPFRIVNLDRKWLDQISD